MPNRRRENIKTVKNRICIGKRYREIVYDKLAEIAAQKNKTVPNILSELATNRTVQCTEQILQNGLGKPMAGPVGSEIVMCSVSLTSRLKSGFPLLR